MGSDRAGLEGRGEVRAECAAGMCGGGGRKAWQREEATPPAPQRADIEAGPARSVGSFQAVPVGWCWSWASEAGPPFTSPFHFSALLFVVGTAGLGLPWMVPTVRLAPGSWMVCGKMFLAADGRGSFHPWPPAAAGDTAGGGVS